ncbi:hypothetical protein [Haloferula sp. A504]|uniref:hypothetical protein n=1 Tax=Haloferula sp. A504 TaxID=3373601 RepID=UPI0031CBEC84|nr:hypothetical protein [Verrucomicrobiaceae bacterium E54]
MQALPPDPGKPVPEEPAPLGPPGRPVFQLARQVWRPAPVARPVIIAQLDRLRWPERSAEVVRYNLLRAEHWLSPSGFLREWIRVSLWLAVVLTVAAVLIIPPVTALLAGLESWSGLVSTSLTNITTAVSAMPPIVLALATAFLVVKLIQRHRATRRPDRHHPYEHYN